MSLPTPLNLDTDELAPSDIFDELLAGNPEVCRKCFKRLRKTTTIPAWAGHKYHDRSATIVRHKPETVEGEPSTTEELDSIEYTESDNTDGLGSIWVHGEPVSKARVSYCASCGTTGIREPPADTRSAAQLLWATDGIVATLREYGVAIDTRELRGAIEELAVKPEWAGDDHGLLTEAVRRANAAATGTEEIEVTADLQ